ncbi:hypothetical protein DFH09DRAFT_1338006 [Mycena vulgaris]|nr:hypothetical protein DFH09DRAFT_1338006 [Mycena vulgaris]
MPRPASLCDIPVSTAFDPNLQSSLLFLDWVLASGLCPNNPLLSGRLCLPYHDSTDGVWSLDVELAISASLPFDLVLGHDWLQLCQTTLPYASFDLASGVLNLQATSRGSPAAAANPSITAFHSGTSRVDSRGVHLQTDAPGSVPQSGYLF